MSTIRGSLSVPIRWMLIRDSQGRFATQALLCTDQSTTPEQLLGWFEQRWHLAVRHEEGRCHRGIATRTRVHRSRSSEAAICRTTPTLLGFFALIALLPHGRMANPTTIDAAGSVVL